jgi:hypothetical protein
MIFENQSKNKKILFAVSAVVLLSAFAFFIWNSSLEEDQASFEFGNDYIEKAVVDYLLTQPHFSWQNRQDTFKFCSIENLNPENDLFPLYVWVYCGEYFIQDGELETVSGSSGPAKINYPNELSFYDLNKFSYEAPGDGSHYGEDIKSIFPEVVQDRISNFNRKNIINKNENAAFISISLWESVKQAIAACEVESVWQTHDRTVGAQLKNGGGLSAVEPKIDDIIKLAESAEPNCGKILMATE